MNRFDTTTTALAPDLDGMHDAKGRWVPAKLIKPIDRQRHETVSQLATKAIALKAQMVTFKGEAIGDLHAFLELAAEQYGVKKGGAKGNLTLASYDGRFKVQIQVQDRLAFGESLQVAKVLVDECIAEWAQGADDKIRALVGHAFQTDKQGKVSTERVLSLRSLAIDDPKWTQAMVAIADSIQVASSATYLRFYERVGEDGDKYEPITLDLAAL